MVLSFDLDAVALEEVDGVLGERGVEHGKDLRGYVVDGNFDERDEARVQLF